MIDVLLLRDRSLLGREAGSEETWEGGLLTYRSRRRRRRRCFWIEFPCGFIELEEAEAFPAAVPVFSYCASQKDRNTAFVRKKALSCSVSRGFCKKRLEDWGFVPFSPFRYLPIMTIFNFILILSKRYKIKKRVRLNNYYRLHFRFHFRLLR